jgi:hypothetical protein
VSSKRRIRRKQCAGKVRHPSRALAEFQRYELVQARLARGPLNVYRCRFCRGFHVGRRSGVAPPAPMELRAVLGARN